MGLLQLAQNEFASQSNRVGLSCFNLCTSHVLPFGGSHTQSLPTSLDGFCSHGKSKRGSRPQASFSGPCSKIVARGLTYWTVGISYRRCWNMAKPVTFGRLQGGAYTTTLSRTVYLGQASSSRLPLSAHCLRWRLEWVCG